MKLLLVFAAVVLTVSTAPHNVKKSSDEDGKLLKLKKKVSDLPTYVNWVEKGAVTSVKDQGECGSCYAFSAAGALEGLFFIQNKTLTDVSEQELVDCSSNDGCDGGLMNNCFQYVINRPGIDSDSAYPYIAIANIRCLAKKNESAGYCTGFTRVSDDSEHTLLNAVATVGPISVAIAVSDDFMNYNGGIFKGGCGSNLNHGVLIVGYGTDNETNEDYWLVKNSWGTDWGENGYIRMERNVNICGIANAASYPTY